MSDNVAVSSASTATGADVTRGDPRVFEQAFADAPDLDGLTYAARRVLAMSASLFYRQGAAATSIREITRACGLTPGALYNHFASKDDVLYVLVRHGHESLERRITTALGSVDDDPVRRTAAFVDAYVTGHLVHPELAQVVRREYLHLSAPRCREIVQRRRRLRHELTEMLRTGATAGRFDLIDGPDNATRVAVMVLDMCSRTSEWYDPERAERAEAPRRLAERYVTASLRLAGVRSGG